MAILHPQEAFLQERFVSVEYVKTLRDTWHEIIAHISRCLSNFSKNPPPDLRARHLSEQPDIVWGGRVIPIFMNTLDNLDDALMLLKNNDHRAYPRLIAGGGVVTDVRGSSDSWDGWLSTQDKDIYTKLIDQAYFMGSRIANTIGGSWSESDLTYSYSQYSDPFVFPSKIPLYELDPSVVIKVGGQLPCRGFYLPDVDHGALAFLHEHSFWPYTALRATKLSQFRSEGKDHDEFYWRSSERVDANWTLVRRIDEKFIDVPPQGFFPKKSPEELTRWAEQTQQDKTHLARAGKPCPKTGLWHALAPDSTRKFHEGDIMPELNLPGFTHTYWYLESE